MLLTLKGELALCPKAHGAKRVLDLGTGTGIWAIEYGTLSGCPSKYR
jgi:methylase of polypeptide subunit release factors